MLKKTGLHIGDYKHFSSLTNLGTVLKFRGTPGVTTTQATHIDITKLLSSPVCIPSGTYHGDCASKGGGRHHERHRFTIGYGPRRPRHSAALDTVNHDILLRRLDNDFNHFGIKGLPL